MFGEIGSWMKSRLKFNSLKKQLVTDENLMHSLIRLLEAVYAQESSLLARLEKSDPIEGEAIAYKIRAMREKKKDLECRLALIRKKVKVVRDQITCVEVIKAARLKGLPKKDELERLVVDVRLRVEKLDELFDRANLAYGSGNSSSNVDDIISELESMAGSRGGVMERQNVDN